LNSLSNRVLSRRMPNGIGDSFVCRDRHVLLNVATPDKVGAHFVIKNTFLEVSRDSGRQCVRRQVSDPITECEVESAMANPQVGPPVTKHGLNKIVKQCNIGEAASLQEQVNSSRSTKGHGEKKDATQLQRVPVGSDGQLTSIGSALHAQKKCSPCAFFHASVRCREGTLCAFCHFNHSIKVRIRPCKGKRERYKKLKDHLFSRIENDPEGFNTNTLHLPPSIAEDEILKAKLMTSLADHRGQVLANMHRN